MVVPDWECRSSDFDFQIFVLLSSTTGARTYESAAYESSIQIQAYTKLTAYVQVMTVANYRER